MCSLVIPLAKVSNSSALGARTPTVECNMCTITQRRTVLTKLFHIGLQLVGCQIIQQHGGCSHLDSIILPSDLRGQHSLHIFDPCWGSKRLGGPVQECTSHFPHPIYPHRSYLEKVIQAQTMLFFSHCPPKGFWGCC